jgi:hypothetical protein
LPPLPMIVPLAVPPDPTSSKPTLLMIVSLAVP